MNLRNGLFAVFITFILLVVAGCGNNSETSATSEKDKMKKLKISASSTPHAEILEFIADDLEKEGVKLDITITTDGIQTNQQTADGELDANFFQHTPYLEQVKKDSGLDLVNVKGIHIEPFGVYSKKINSIEELSNGAQIGIPKDPVNFSRALELFATKGLLS